MAFTNTKVIEAAVKSAIAKGLAQIDQVQQQLIEEQRGLARHLIGQVTKLEARMAALEKTVLTPLNRKES